MGSIGAASADGARLEAASTAAPAPAVRKKSRLESCGMAAPFAVTLILAELYRYLGFISRYSKPAGIASPPASSEAATIDGANGRNANTFSFRITDNTLEDLR